MNGLLVTQETGISVWYINPRRKGNAIVPDGSGLSTDEDVDEIGQTYSSGHRQERLMIMKELGLEYLELLEEMQYQPISGWTLHLPCYKG